MYLLKLWFIKFRGLLKREWKSYKSYFLLNVWNTEQHNQRETVDNYRKWNKSIVLNAMCYFLMILSRIINPFFLPSLGCKDFKHVIKFTCVHNQNRYRHLVGLYMNVAHRWSMGEGVICRLEEIVVFLNSMLLQQSSVFLSH